MDSTPITSSEKTPKNYKYYAVTAALVITAILVTYFVQNRRINTIQKQLSSSQNQYQLLESDSKDLAGKNDNLKLANNALQQQVDDSEITIESTVAAPEVNTEITTESNDSVSVAAKPAGELKIVKFLKEPKINFAGEYDEFKPEGDVLALYVSITNTSGAEQEYSVWDFKAITENGEAVDSTTYLPSLSESWNNSMLIDGGSKEVALLYNDINLKIVSLQWTAPGGSKTITLPVPTLSN